MNSCGYAIASVNMLEWIRTHDTALWWLAAASVATFAATLIIVPWIVVRIPADYFTHRRRRRMPWADQHPLVQLSLRIAKNVLGVGFIIVGVALLLLPGQGILTILVGIILLDFPGKFRLERSVVASLPVRRSIDWFRRRAGRTPLEFDD